MPLSPELRVNDPAVTLASTDPAFYGPRPALILGASMVLAFALITLLRWTGGPAAASEKVVQLPVPADATTSSPRADLTAPDPGDSPP